MSLRHLALVLAGAASLFAQSANPVPSITGTISLPNGFKCSLPIGAFQLDETLAPPGTSLSSTLNLQLTGGVLDPLTLILDFLKSNPVMVTLMVQYCASGSTSPLSTTTIKLDGLTLCDTATFCNGFCPTLTFTTTQTPSVNITAGTQQFSTGPFDVSFYDGDNGASLATTPIFVDYPDVQGTVWTGVNFPADLGQEWFYQFGRPWLGDDKLPNILMVEVEDKGDFSDGSAPPPYPPVFVQFSFGTNIFHTTSNTNPMGNPATVGLICNGSSSSTLTHLTISATNHGSDQETVSVQADASLYN
jgi:hypothetical protein